MKNPSKNSHAHTFFQDIWFDPNDASKGYINSKFNTLRRSLPKSEQQRPRKDKSPTVSCEESVSTKKLTSAPQKRTFSMVDEIPEAEEEELVLFCKRTSVYNRQDIIQAMGKSFQNRRNWIQKELPCVSEIMNRYPRFRDTPGLVSCCIN